MGKILKLGYVAAALILTVAGASFIPVQGAHADGDGGGASVASVAPTLTVGAGTGVYNYTNWDGDANNGNIGDEEAFMLEVELAGGLLGGEDVTVASNGDGTGTITINTEGMAAGTYTAYFYLENMDGTSESFELPLVIPEVPVVPTAVEATFADGSDATTIKSSGTVQIVTNDAENVVHTYDYDENYITVDEDGNITVNDDFVSSADQDVTITINGFIDGTDTVLTAKTLTLTIEANYLGYQDGVYEFVEGDGQTYTKGSDETLTFKVSGPHDQVDAVVIYNISLWEYLGSIDTSGMTMEEVHALLTDEEWACLEMELTEGEDYIIAQGSTIITLTDSLLSRLVAGEYGIDVEYYNDADRDAIFWTYAEGTFTIADPVEAVAAVAVTTPDTGVFTEFEDSGNATRAGVGGLAVVAVLGAVAMLVGAVKFARSRK